MEIDGGRTPSSSRQRTGADGDRQRELAPRDSCPLPVGNQDRETPSTRRALLCPRRLPRAPHLPRPTRPRAPSSRRGA